VRVTDERSPVQSVDRALEILEFLAARGEAGVTDLATHLGVHKSTAFRLLGALEARGLVEQPDVKYRLGTGLLRLASAVPVQRDITGACRRACEELADECGETVNVAIAHAGAAINIDQVRGGGSWLVSHNWIGERTPLHATSSGKVLLAADPGLIPARLPRFTAATITKRADLDRELAEVRRTGVAYTHEELEPTLTAAAAPVRGHDGRVVAAISVAGPTFRMDATKLAAVAKAVIRAADQASHRLGWRPATET
jgi:DNA-binding IclR family transcriptional regulator